jgi:bifunctional UDP-N-acetylglucosamine pyrophosphorylase/glucosamine-1-phosphate N-acetyltransferase
MQELVALIFASGEGTGMKSSEAKYAHKICGQAMVSYAIESSIEAGSDVLAIFLDQNGDDIKDLLPENIAVAYNTGTTGIWDAVWKEKHIFENRKGTLLVFPADYPALSVYSLKTAFSYHIDNSNQATVLTTPKGELSEVCFFDIETLNTVLTALKKEDEERAVTLSDILRSVESIGQKACGFSISISEELLRVDDRIKLNEAEKIVSERIIRKHMENGVTFHLPHTSFIHAKVKIGKDTEILPGTILEGDTIIGEKCLIGPYSRIEDGIIGNGVSFMNSVMTQSQIGDNTKVGPFAYIRPGSNIGSNIKIGDFVEIKNSTIGDNSKIPHLSYIGDAQVGKNVNVGCGAITVNYDGKIKHKTVIGDYAFIGCNVNLVSPVTVNDNAYIAAGSTITDEVPEFSLAIARSRQTIINDWVIRKGLKKK